LSGLELNSRVRVDGGYLYVHGLDCAGRPCCQQLDMLIVLQVFTRCPERRIMCLWSLPAEAGMQNPVYIITTLTYTPTDAIRLGSSV
jgi:hypothetical protein